MDVENLDSWASQPDVCRCCLSASGTLDITASYISESGIKEVFSDMLQECYGITLSHLTSWGPSHMVCGLCVGHLREACSFRNQVLLADKHFNEHWAKTDVDKDMQVKYETEASPVYYGDDDVRIDKNYEYSNEETVPTKKLEPSRVRANIESHKTRRKRHRTDIKGKRKRKKIVLEKDYDSDVPIAFLLENHVSLHEGQKEMADTEREEDRGRHQTTTNGVKQVSERKRIMLTCCTVLRDTTACPFRHHKSWFQCFFCSQDFMEINLLRTHTSLSHSDVDAELKKIKRYPRSLQIEISNLECRQCNLNLIDVETMRCHLGEVHDKVIYSECIADYKVDSSPYSCHICKREFHVFRTLTTHLNEHYANCICDVCGKSFINSKRLKVHKRTHENGQYPCNECGKVLKTKTSKANHMESAHSKRQLKCQICFKPMKHYNDRIKHMSEAHNITHKFLCPICGREYNIKHYLATHMRQTHGHKNKKCNECGMAFITNHGLKKHMLKHTGEKPYTCNICNKSYARSYTLREHMRAHDNERIFACE